MDLPLIRLWVGMGGDNGGEMKPLDVCAYIHQADIVELATLVNGAVVTQLILLTWVSEMQARMMQIKMTQQ